MSACLPIVNPPAHSLSAPARIHIAVAMPAFADVHSGDARTFLTHFAGSGLDDDRYVVKRFRSLANKVLKNDNRAIFQAAAHAQRAVDFLHGLQEDKKMAA